MSRSKSKNIRAKYWPKPQSEKLTDIVYRGMIQLSDDGKWYKVLSAGVMHSKKYHGVWDVHNYSCEPGAGEIDVKLNFLEATLNNFLTNKNETQPFVDIDHESGVSLGPITGMKIEGNSLFIQPEWNPRGLETVANKEYMYFSISLGNHVDSKTGAVSFPVMSTTSLTNIPVVKDQDMIELSEAAPTGNQATVKIDSQCKILTLGENPMDELKELFAALVEKCNALIEGDETGINKTLVHALIENMEEQTGTADGDEEEGKEDMAEKKPVAPAPAPVAPAPSTDAPTQMSESEIRLAEVVKTQNASIKAMELKLAENDFDKAFLNRKVTPAQKPAMFALYLSDKKNATAILASMPDLNLLRPSGTDADLNLAETSPAEARKVFDDKVLTLSEAEKIDSLKAVEKIKKAEPALYTAAYGKIK